MGLCRHYINLLPTISTSISTSTPSPSIAMRKGPVHPASNRLRLGDPLGSPSEERLAGDADESTADPAHPDSVRDRVGLALADLEDPLQVAHRQEHRQLVGGWSEWLLRWAGG